MEIGILEELGLSNAEAKIYMALLELGPSKSGKVIDRTNLQSSTVYHVMGSLIEKGLVSFVHQGKVKHYQAEKPSTFLFFLEEKKRKFMEMLPRLEEKEALASQKQAAQVFKGIKGLQAAFSDVLVSMKPGEEYYFFQVPKKNLFNKQVVLFFRNYHLKRSEKGIKVKGLSLRGSQDLMEKVFGGLKNTKIRYLDEFTPSGIVIYRNKVITLDWEDVPIAIVMESKAIADSYKKFFEEKWKKASPKTS